MTIKKQNIIKQVKINNKIIAVFCYEKNDNSVDKYIKEFIKQYKKLIKFFNKQPPKITINFIYTRKEMDKHWGAKSPGWLNGMVDNKNPYQIYIFSPKVTRKLTNSKKSEILPTIVHETAHAFVTEINERCYYWMNEGICQYVEAKNVKNNIVKKKDWVWFIDNNAFWDPDLEWKIQANHDGYKIAYNLVKYILGTKGKNNFIKLLRIKREGDSEKLKQKINKIVGDMDLLLDIFGKNLKLV